MDLLKEQGKSFSAKINGYECIGKIQVEHNAVYLCQDVQTGTSCKNKLGYSCSWIVDNGSDFDLKSNKVYDFKIIEQEEKKDDVLNRLPKYWAVKGDGGSKVFKDVLIPFFIEKYNKIYTRTSDKYYGYDGRKEDRGAFCGSLDDFRNVPTILTLEEFINLITNTTNNTNNTNNLTINENNYEKSSIKVQRQAPVITSGKRWTGNTISGGRSKVAISIGHLSNSAIYQ